MALTDPIMNATVATDVLHFRIHSGDAFVFEHVDTALGNNGSIDILVSTGAARFLHLVFLATCGGVGRVQMYEGASVSANGTELTPTNRNRSSSNGASFSAYHTPTVDTEGTSLIDAIIPGGGPSASSSGDTIGGDRAEFILKQSTLYLLRLTNISGSAKAASLSVDVYESKTSE